MLLLTSAVFSSPAQSDRGNVPASIAIVYAPGSPRSAEEVLREIDDPATGYRWLLERDLKNPGGPGRLVLAATGMASQVPARASAGSAGGGFANGLSAALIHPGDHLIVEEHTRFVDAVLEAIAMGTARQGGPLRVRLSIGGRVVNAVAVAPGSAVFSPDAGVQP
jgi:hypothetical protein